MDSTGLQHLDWVNYHHISRNPDTMKPLPNQSTVSSLYSSNQENLHLNNTIKDYSDGNELDQQNLNILESDENSCDRLENNTTLTNDGDNDLWDSNSGFQQLKKNSYNNNITAEDFPRIVSANCDGAFDEEDLRQLSDLTKPTDLKYDLSCLHLSDRGSQFRRIRDAECESVSSDYSEVVGPLRDLADNEIEIFNSSDLEETIISEKCNSFSTRSETLQQNPDETDEEFHKRVKKVNFLSLAQEFAELKKIDADVLPFDLHKTDFSDYSPMSEESSFTESTMTSPADLAETPTDSYDFVRDENSNELDNVDCCDTEGLQSGGRLYKTDSAANSYKPNFNEMNNLDVDVVANSKHGKPNFASWENKQKKNGEVKTDSTGAQDCEIYDIEDTLPKMDWETLEQQLALVVEEKSHCNDREEIRRKLAMGGDEDLYNTDRLYKKANAQSRYSTGMNLQLCFMSEKAPTANPGEADVGPTEPASASIENVATQQKLPSSSSYRNFSDLKSNWSRHLRDHNMQQVAPPKPPRKKVDAESEEEDFFKKQAQLQEEAKLALAQASTMAHMQLEVEKQMKKKSPIAEMVGIPGFGDGRQKRLERKLLLDMNVAQLQVIVNDLLSQIKSLNEDLVQMLLDRDDLHMEQDSMLVDIEDLTRRTQEFAKKINSKQKKDKKK
ncbi:Hypothetical predicted protein [Octopus vulgaris]|nr:Hypothetical predicted protein [Octopus vulgaris]